MSHQNLFCCSISKGIYTFESSIKAKTYCYNSIKHNHIFIQKWICFGLKRPSSGHHYKNFRIRYNTVQIMLVIWDPIYLTKIIKYMSVRMSWKYILWIWLIFMEYKTRHLYWHIYCLSVNLAQYIIRACGQDSIIFTHIKILLQLF